MVRRSAPASIRRVAKQWFLCRMRRRNHSLATGLLRQGGSLDEIGELLRHQSPDTAANYAKVDVIALHTLALPWPGGSR